MLKKRISQILSALLIFSMLGLYVHADDDNTSDKLVIYVSSADGADTNDGKISAPLKTVEEARNRAIKARKTNKFSAIDIILREGIYEREKTFYIGEDNGGADNCSVTYRGYDGENVIISGSKSLDGSVVQKVYDRRILSKLAQDYAYDKLYVIDANLLDITLSKEIMIGENRFPGRGYGSRNPTIEINGAAGHIARWPDNGYMEVKSVISDGNVGNDAEDPDGAEFELYQDRMKYWQSDTAYMYGRYKTGWQDQTLPIVSTDIEKKSVKTSDPPKSGINKDAVSVYFYNIFEEISQSGEYYADVSNNKIYFCADSIDNLRLIKLKEPLLELENVSNVTFSNITFDGALNNGITLSNCTNILFENCTVKNIGAKAAVFDDDCKNCGMRASSFNNVFDGIYIGGGNFETLTSGNNFIENCIIKSFGRQCYARGAALSGVGNRISGCTFKDSENMAVQLSGVNNTIEYCEFSGILKHTGDMGVIYAGSGWVMRGNKIINNYFHDIYSEKDFMLGTKMIYLDLASSGVTISGNVFENTSGQGIVSSCGSDNKIYNNIFVKCSTAVYIAQYKEINEECNRLYKSISAYLTNKIWTDTFPELKYIDDKTYKSERLEVKNNIIADSTHLDFGLNDITDDEIDGFSQNYITNTTDLFENFNQKNFKINSDDVKSKLIGYTDIDVTKCGSNIDEKKSEDSAEGIESGEIIASCGFEDGTVNNGRYSDSANGNDFISVEDNNNQRIETDSGIAHGGSKSILIETPRYSAPCFKLSADTNTLYKMSVWVHSNISAGAAENSMFSVLANGSADVYALDKNIAYKMHGYETAHHSQVTKDGWTLLERYFICPSDENKKVNIKLGVYSAVSGESVKYNLDDFKITRIENSAISADFAAGQDIVYSKDAADMCYTAALSVSGSDIYDVTATYSIKSPANGVSIDSHTGKLTVAEDIEGSVTVTAQINSKVFGSRVCEKRIQIINDEIPKLDSVLINKIKPSEFSSDKYDYYNQPYGLSDDVTAASEYTVTSEAIDGTAPAIRISVLGKNDRTVYNFYIAKEVTGENKVSDGGFESGVNDSMYPKNAVSITNDESHSGEYSAKVKLGKYNSVYYNFYAEKDKLYLVSMWVRLSGESNEDNIFLTALDGCIYTDDLSKSCGGGLFDDDNTNYKKQSKIYSDKWVRLNRIFYVESSGQVNVGIGYYGESLECYIDDVYISELVNGDKIKAELEKDKDFYEICTQSLSEHEAMITVISRTKADDKNGCLITASYEYNLLKGFYKFDTRLNKTEVIDLPFTDGYKVFLWRDLENITPLTQNISKTNKRRI